MAFDLRANQLRTAKVIGQRVGGTGPQLMLYPSASATDLAGTNTVDLSAVGNDVWLVVNGEGNSRGDTTQGGVLFQGDVILSQSLHVDGDAHFTAGLTGSIAEASLGVPFIIGGGNVTATYNAQGQWDIVGNSSSPAPPPALIPLAGFSVVTLSSPVRVGMGFVEPTIYNVPPFTRQYHFEATGFVTGGTATLELYSFGAMSPLATLTWTETDPTHKISTSFMVPGPTTFDVYLSIAAGGGGGGGGGGGSDFASIASCNLQITWV